MDVHAQLVSRHQQSREARKKAQGAEAEARLALEQYYRGLAFELGYLLSFGRVHQRCWVEKDRVVTAAPRRQKHPHPVVAAVHACWDETAQSLARAAFAVPRFACHVDRQARLRLIEFRPVLTSDDQHAWRDLDLPRDRELKLDTTVLLSLEPSLEEGCSTTALHFGGVGLSVVCEAGRTKVLSDLRSVELLSWISFVETILRRTLNQHK